MDLIINNRTLRLTITILLAFWIWQSKDPIPSLLWIIIAWITIMWLISRPKFDFEYQISMSWVSIFLAVTGLILVSTGYQAFESPNIAMMQIGLYVLGVSALLGIQTYFDTNIWVKVESAMAIIGLLLLLLSQLPALANIEIIRQFGKVLFAVGVSVMVLTYTKKLP